MTTLGGTGMATSGGLSPGVPVRFLTFNIWFSPHEMARRMNALGDIIATADPDFVALQEMTHDHWALCMRHHAFQRFEWSPLPAQRYFTMVGSVRPFLSAPQRMPFSMSRMQRDLLFVSVVPRNASLPPILFATSHLESMDEAQVRRLQMDEAIRHLDNLARSGQPQDIVFCGDTNIDDRLDGHIEPPPPWTDAWLEVHAHDAGATFDTERNGMVQAYDSWARSTRARLRYDRFWLRPRGYFVTGVNLVGTEPLNVPGAAPLWPSDHFGVLLDLQPRQVR